MSAPAREILITAGAERDLAGIYRRRLAQRGEQGDDGAEALLSDLVQAIHSLAELPAKGPIVPELAELGISDYRQLSRSPYRIIYWPEPKRVKVLIIADARRDFRTLLAERVLGA